MPAPSTSARFQVPLYPSRAEAVTKSDTVDFDEPSTVYVGVGGVVAAIPWEPGNATVVNFTIPTGGVVPCTLRRVNSTNTTATTMVRVY